ncbi:MAG TPA: fasciclin, partial [Agrobacterium sp.]|nr:fasciclin [Agrobacterium sp.]
MIRSTIRTLALATIVSAISASAFAANPMVGGAAMYDNKNIVEN